jgi:uncharacterized protein YndB with AHSA1/START domain
MVKISIAATSREALTRPWRSLSRSANAAMSTRTTVVAHVTRHFDAPIERVFDAWLTCSMIERWMFGPAVRDEEIVRLSIDPRVGGAFSFVVEREGEEIDHLGKYLEIDRPRRLAFTWVVVGEKAGSRVTVDIAPQGAACELTLAHEMHPDWAEFVGRTEEAWQKMLEALAAALAETDKA